MKIFIIKLSRSPGAKKMAGVALVVVGVVALLTPLTPGSWLALVGLELLGVRILFPERLAGRLKRLSRRRSRYQSPPELTTRPETDTQNTERSSPQS